MSRPPRKPPARKPARPPSATGGRGTGKPATRKPAERKDQRGQGSRRQDPRRGEPVYRLRRFPPLPWRLKAALAVGWLAVVVAVLFLVPTWSGRLGLVVVATAALPLIVVLVRDPSRRTR